MSYNIGNYTHVHSYHIGKKGYVNKFEKSIKLPFLNVLNNHLPNTKPADADDSKIDYSDIAVNDKIKLSSAVVSASDASDSEAGGTDSGSAT